MFYVGKHLQNGYGGEPNARELGLFMRYQATADRGFNNCLAELRKIQKARKIQEIGSVWQQAREERELAETSLEPGPIWAEFIERRQSLERQSPEIQAQNFR